MDKLLLLLIIGILVALIAGAYYWYQDQAEGEVLYQACLEKCAIDLGGCGFDAYGSSTQESKCIACYKVCAEKQGF